MSTNDHGKHVAAGEGRRAGTTSTRSSAVATRSGASGSTWRDKTGVMRRAAHREAAAHRAGRRARPPLRDQRRCPTAPCDFLRKHRDDTKPYFLEVATYGPHAQMTKAYPDNPPFPSAFADRAPTGRPDRRQLRHPPLRRSSRCSDLKGYDDPRADNAPTYLQRDGTTRPAPAWNTNPVTLRRPRRPDGLSRPGPDGAVDRPDARPAPCRGRSEHLLLPHLRQRLPPRTAPAQRRQGHAVRLRHARPARRHRAGCAAGHAQPVRQQHRPGADLRVARRAASAGLPVGDLVRGQPASARGRGVAGSSSTTTPTRSHAPARWTATAPWAGTSSRSRRTSRCGASAACWCASTSTTPGAGTDYAWELYRYDVPWEDRNVFAEDHDKPWARELMRRLRMWDDCAPAQCRAATR